MFLLPLQHISYLRIIVFLVKFFYDFCDCYALSPTEFIGTPAMIDNHGNKLLYLISDAITIITVKKFVVLRLIWCAKVILFS